MSTYEPRSMRILPAGALILSPDDARMLYQAARIKELRSRYRVGDSAIYDLLRAITICAFSTAPGNEPRQETASEERSHWTVNQIAQATRRAPRTVRLDIERKTLPAVKHGNTWVITNDDAKTYITGHSPRQTRNHS
ncbi:hypothetical protein [Microbacterium album]|uniref:Helix-turn-helix domain-containing protein n=1 Tax=Microbacterium album TaxID=2053191 RepID=A0A917MLV9_9MICO|nr:hypothetical protein [Microbacterium album]GGH44968.1 hypothetical protein GCM10010921_20040 [Microbacterium album]